MKFLKDMSFMVPYETKHGRAGACRPARAV